MDVSYTLHEIEFEWDQRKSKTNLRKHKISFETACEVFFDPFLRVVNAATVEGEPREAVIGMTTNWRLLCVVFVEREEVIRLLSARAVKKEKERYMKISKLKQRLRKDRAMTTISIRIPEDVVSDLKEIAPRLGFSGYQPLIRAYVGQGLRSDLDRLNQQPKLSHLVKSLRKHGVKDDVIASAIAEINGSSKAA